MRIGVKAGQYGWSFDDLLASWEVAEEAGFDVLACFDHVSSSPEGGQAWDAPTLLAAMAGRTHRIALGVYVLNASMRHPFLLAAQVAVAQAVSGGRVEVGIGTGSHYFARYDHEVLGIPFPSFADRLARLDACCRILPALWRGEQVTDEGSGLRGAALGHSESSLRRFRWVGSPSGRSTSPSAVQTVGMRHRWSQASSPPSRKSWTERARRRVGRR